MRWSFCHGRNWERTENNFSATCIRLKGRLNELESEGSWAALWGQWRPETSASWEPWTCRQRSRFQHRWQLKTWAISAFCGGGARQGEVFKPDSGRTALIPLPLLLNDRQVPTSLSFLQVNWGFCTFCCKEKKCPLLSTLGRLSAHHLQPRAWAFVLFTCLLWNINTFFWIWEIPSGPEVKKKIKKEGKKTLPLLSREKEFEVFPGQTLDTILLLHLWINSHFKQNYFPLKLLLGRHIPKSLKRNVLHRNNVMHLMYSDSCQHAGL